MNELEENFVASLHALLVRYGVVIVEQKVSFNKAEREIVFCNGEEDRSKEIYLPLNELLSAVGKVKTFSIHK